MIATIIALTTAHLVADFSFQSDWMVQRKKAPGVMSLHILIVATTAAVTLGWLAWPVLGWIVLTHFVIDAAKTHFAPPGIVSFAIDQALHLIVIAALAIAYPDTAERGLWSLLPTSLNTWLYVAMIGLGALVAAVSTGGIVIGMAMARIATTETAKIGGLQDGGRYIGWLERALTLLFIAIDQPSAIGLLLAAKSILRFGDIMSSDQRERAEYIMIGTFMSIGWALCIGVAARKLALHLIH